MVKRRGIAVCGWLILSVIAPARATVFINEILINPSGTLDDFTEFIELMGTPGKKLDGYAVGLVNGGTDRYWPLHSIPPYPVGSPQIDEFFSLDGLSLGANGLLVLAIAPQFQYPDVSPDSTFQAWTNVWNGNPVDPPGKLENDGSNTLILIRGRPGVTQAQPNHPGGSRWFKSVFPDNELVTPVFDEQAGLNRDQFGNGSVDRGDPNGRGGSTTDLRGYQTPDDVTDDLEIVDEISYEGGRGWEYDVDERTVDRDSDLSGSPQRRVHALDDPQGFTPDALSRVDYRVKGPGWIPVGGATGDMPNGNNWPDTATQQWVRGETTATANPDDTYSFYYDNNPNTNPDSIQPFLTHVPGWLHDGMGTNYDFSQLRTYRIKAGSVNPLAVPFIPGDVDRDGDCDDDDIAKISAVFGDDDWVFSNGFDDAPEGDSGDPAIQTRPWDVDGTGDNGIESNDLQWLLNFQGDTTGRIVGVAYEGAVPSATGVHLNSPGFSRCELSWSFEVPSGHALDALATGELIEITVSGQVTLGANANPGEENGIMQYVHDLTFSSGGVVRVVGVEPIAPFQVTRASLVESLGAGGDQGAALIHGFTKSFTEGVDESAHLYRIRLRTVGIGSSELSLSESTDLQFAMAAPFGVKLGHTAGGGNPSLAFYPDVIGLSVIMNSAPAPANCDADPTTTHSDQTCFTECLSGPGGDLWPGCDTFNLHLDSDVDLLDWAVLQNDFDGP